MCFRLTQLFEQTAIILIQFGFIQILSSNCDNQLFFQIVYGKELQFISISKIFCMSDVSKDLKVPNWPKCFFYTIWRIFAKPEPSSMEGKTYVERYFSWLVIIPFRFSSVWKIFLFYINSNFSQCDYAKPQIWICRSLSSKASLKRHAIPTLWVQMSRWYCILACLALLKPCCLVYALDLKIMIEYVAIGHIWGPWIFLLADSMCYRKLFRVCTVVSNIKMSSVYNDLQTDFTNIWIAAEEIVQLSEVLLVQVFLLHCCLILAAGHRKDHIFSNNLIQTSLKSPFTLFSTISFRVFFAGPCCLTIEMYREAIFLVLLQ